MAQGLINGVDTAPGVETVDRRPGLIRRLASWCVRRRWIVIGSWVVLLVGVNVGAGAVGPDYRTDFALPDGEAKRVQELLEANNPDRAGFTSQIVVRSEQGINEPGVRRTLEYQSGPSRA